MHTAPGSDDTLLRALTELLAWLDQQGYAFRTVTPATHARVNARPGTQTAHSVRDIFGWSRPFAPALLPPALIDLLDSAGLVEQRPDGTLRSAVRASTLEGRLYAHSAYPTDADDAVFFGPDTYRFARLLRDEMARSPVPAQGRVLDLGCGAGCGGILVALECGTAPETCLSDVNLKALAFARANARYHGCAVQTVQSDLLRAVEGEFDWIIANPPFLNDAAQRNYRHGGGSRGEALSVRIVQEALPRVRPGGRLVLYTASAIVGGDDLLLRQIEQVLRGAPCKWRYEEIDPDVFGEELESPAYQDVDRIAAVALVAERPHDPMRWFLHPAMA